MHTDTRFSDQIQSSPPKPTRGGILADEMGLGKTLSMLSLIMSTLVDARKFEHRPPPHFPGRILARNLKGTLLVLPLSTLSQWEVQIQTHLAPGALKYYIYYGTKRTRDIEELAQYDLVITTYQTLQSEYSGKKTGQPISSSHWFRVVLDEAHIIRAQNTQTAKAIFEIAAQRSWAMTGTPIQNRLEDLVHIILHLVTMIRISR
jgi:SNF2 family DNA or RNA helicase